MAVADGLFSLTRTCDLTRGFEPVRTKILLTCDAPLFQETAPSEILRLAKTEVPPLPSHLERSPSSIRRSHAGTHRLFPALPASNRKVTPFLMRTPIGLKKTSRRGQRVWLRPPLLCSFDRPQANLFFFQGLDPFLPTSSLSFWMPVSRGAGHPPDLLCSKPFFSSIFDTSHQGGVLFH